jgi:FtsZ-binding cell division protein ZapB
VMTRLRLRERRTLDTLVDAGVARSRSEALAWCVKLVGDHQGEWIEQLRDALGRVEEVRSTGPKPGSSGAAPTA